MWLVIKNMFADNLKKARLDKRLSQKALASALFLSQQAYCRYENGSAAPSPEILAKICMLLGVTADELLGNDKAPTVEQNGERSVLDITDLSPENRDRLEDYLHLLLNSQNK